MKVILYAAALRARYSVAPGQAVDIPDDLAAHYLNVGVAAPARGKQVERADRGPSENAALDFEIMTKDELVALASERGIDVERADGESGAPLKSDYVRALA